MFWGKRLSSPQGTISSELMIFWTTWGVPLLLANVAAGLMKKAASAPGWYATKSSIRISLWLMRGKMRQVGRGEKDRKSPPPSVRPPAP